MNEEFLNRLSAGYCARQYDLDKKKIENFVDDFFRFIFFLEYHRCDCKDKIKERLESFRAEFQQIIHDVVQDKNERKQIVDSFFDELPKIHQLLEKDARFILDSDPAATSVEEVMISYPGFYAIAVYRMAHYLHQQKVPLLPRIWTELAHSRTGIDIHPGARIGESFFIDHGTGIVIGETTTIGNHVKIYQNVTLGALAVTKDIANTKRHPTIEDNVTIYAGATILGGETVIGRFSTIGGNVWLTESIDPYSLVYYKDKTIIRSKERPDEVINFSI